MLYVAKRWNKQKTENLLNEKTKHLMFYELAVMGIYLIVSNLDKYLAFKLSFEVHKLYGSKTICDKRWLSKFSHLSFNQLKLCCLGFYV